MNLLKTALFIFIISQIPGDTFYGDLGLTQSLFIVPLLLVYLFSGHYVPLISPLRNAGFVFAGILTAQLIIFQFEGIVEWYRTIGGLILAFMVVSLCSNRRNNRNQIVWLAFAGSIPIMAFYLGFWESGADNQFRMSFLRHDPNHLGHLIIFGFAAMLAVIQSSDKVSNKWIWATVGIYFIPLAFTFSRTSLLAFVVVLILYFTVLLNKRRIATGILGFFILLAGTVVLLSSQNVIVEGFSERFSEKNDTRSNFNAAGLELIKSNFFTGVGVAKFQDPEWRIANGFYRTKFDEYGSGEVATSTHNGFLDVFLIGGIFMFGAFICIIAYPAFFLVRKGRYFLNDAELRWRKYLVYAFTTSFVLINLTYSLYNSKLGWWGVAFSYVLIAPYYSRRRGYFFKRNKP